MEYDYFAVFPQDSNLCETNEEVAVMLGALLEKKQNSEVTQLSAASLSTQDSTRLQITNWSWGVRIDCFTTF